MASIVQLKRSALSGKVPGTGSLNLGELALNTYDGKIFFRRSGSTDTVQEVITSNTTNTGSVTITGTLTAASIVGSISASNGVVSGSSQVIGILSSLNSYTASVSGTFATTGSNTFVGNQTFNNDVTVLGAINARQFNIGIISSSILYQSGSNKFGDTSDDTHQFTGSVQITGSLYLNGTALGGTSAAASGTFVFPENFDYSVYDTGSFLDFNSQSLAYNLNFNTAVAVGSPIQYIGALSHIDDKTKIYPTATSIDTIVGDVYVGSVSSQSFYTNLPITASGLNISGPSSFTGNLTINGAISASSFTGSILSASYSDRANVIGIYASTTNVDAYPLFANVIGASSVSVLGNSGLRYNAGTNTMTVGVVSATTYLGGLISGSSQLTSSYDGRYLVTGSVTSSINQLNSYTSSNDTKWSTLSNVTSSLIAKTGSLATTGSNSFNGTQIITGSVIQSGSLTSYGPNTFYSNTLQSGSITIYPTSGSTIAAIVVSGSGTIGGTNYIDFLRVTNTVAGATNVNTTFRKNAAGTIEMINSAYNNAVLTIDDSGSINTQGSITMPNRPAFRIYGNGGSTSATTVISGSNTTVEYNQGNAWNNTTGTFTAPIAGLYQVNIVGRTAANNNAGINQIIVRKNSGGNLTTQVMIEWGPNTSANHIGGSTISKLAVGDTLQAIVAAGTISFDGNDNFSVAYIG